jgi:hypothetical protein
MHTNHKLNFGHDIGFEIFQDNADPALEISINGTVVFNETFEKGIVHARSANFYHEYLDRKKNCVRFTFSGPAESANRYVKLKRISINSTYINVMQNYWKPEINQEWWDTLNESAQKEMKKRIYGNNNAIFGWYGTFDYYFNSGIDFSSKYKGCEEDLDTQIGIRPLWITLSKNTINNPWQGTKDD